MQNNKQNGQIVKKLTKGNKWLQRNRKVNDRKSILIVKHILGKSRYNYGLRLKTVLQNIRKSIRK